MAGGWGRRRSYILRTLCNGKMLQLQLVLVTVPIPTFSATLFLVLVAPEQL